MPHDNRFRFLRVASAASLILCGAAAARAVDLEAFEFNDASGTTLGGAANSVNPGNLWIEDPEMAPSDVRGGVYNIVKPSSAVDTNFLQIDNVTSGSVWYTAQMANWNFVGFDPSNPEQFRISFLNDDDDDFGSTITAEARIERDAVTGDIVVSGLALGSGATDVPRNDIISTVQPGPFTLSLKLDKDSDTYAVYYKDGSNATRVLGRGLADPGRDANSIRMVANNSFGEGSFDYPFFTDEVFAIDRLAVSDTSPFNDLLTLEVDRTTGAMTLRNTSGASVTGWSGYTIESAGGSLDPTGWDPIGGSIGSSTTSVLSETFASQSLANNGSVVLSTASGAWLESPFEDLSMELTLSGGGTRSVDVEFVGGAGRFVAGDFNTDGVIDAADYLLLAANAETNLAGLTAAESVLSGDLDGDGQNSILDFIQFKSLYEEVNGGGSFAQMIASIPEPTTLGLVAASALALVTGRRRTRQPAFTTAGTTSMRPQTLASLLAALTFALLPATASAVIIEDFAFNESIGTTLDLTTNAGNPGNAWVVDPDLTDTATNGIGSLRIRNATTSLESNYLEIDNITTGKAWLVVEMAGWSFNTDTINPANFDPTNREQVRFAFLNNDNDPPSGSTLTGQFQIERTTEGGVQLIGNTAGSGSTNIAGAYALTNDRSTPFTVALEVDVTDTVETYSVYYKDGAAPFTPLGTGTIAPGRDANSIRFAISDSFAGDGEFFDINRVYLTDEDPLGVVAPTTLSLEVNTLTGGVTIHNPTDAPINFDSYRIASDAGQLNAARWVSLADQEADAVGGGAGENWVESGGSGAGVLAESFLLGESEMVAGELAALGPVFAGGAQDLTFQYRDTATGQLVIVEPTYVTGPVYGDYNNDGSVNAADYTVWRDGNGDSDGNNDGSVNSADYFVWMANYGATSIGVTAIPEPSSIAVLLTAGALLGSGVARRR
ncbi:PEP-CTERM sorting domain-containing protein [Botrimarina mediterranea]|uniref:PEP-CTERM motif protein n=1 Tax=Botrimarina mediterranea TaxID=2528022 RepID=A0A518K3X4_9BACT|nr:PEP-CTERM sorting domain-containing protein [Botrimarina mediterranea]QDV72514.1 PEP-CTERM motif protein [Botrimarina mediterranea]QDV77086.1 PEP-CTERM motif protein [Planctomycetes bacterium K2D]